MNVVAGAHAGAYPRPPSRGVLGLFCTQDVLREVMMSQSEGSMWGPAVATMPPNGAFPLLALTWGHFTPAGPEAPQDTSIFPSVPN